MKRDIFAQLRAVGFDIHMHRENPRIDEWYVSTPAGQWGPFPDMLEALVEGIKLLINQTVAIKGSNIAFISSGEQFPDLKIDDLDLLGTNNPDYVIRRVPTNDYLTCQCGGQIVTFRRMEPGEIPDLNSAFVVKFEGNLWVTATYSDYAKWMALAEQDLGAEPDLGAFGRFLEDLDRSA